MVGDGLKTRGRFLKPLKSLNEEKTFFDKILSTGKLGRNETGKNFHKKVSVFTTNKNTGKESFLFKEFLFNHKQNKLNLQSKKINGRTGKGVPGGNSTEVHEVDQQVEKEKNRQEVLQ